MSFITLNGVTVKVVDCSLKPITFGEASRGVGGSMRREVRAIKRSWDLRVRALNPDDGYGLVQMLLGLGQGFTFDTDIYSASKSYPTGTPVYTQPTTTGADLAPVMIGAPGVSPAKFGVASIAVEPTITNLLTANQATVETDVTGFTAIDGATLTRVTTNKWQATASLQVVTSAVVNATRGGVEVAAVATTTAVHTVSAYIKATSGVTIRVVGRNGTSATDGTPTTVTLTANTWHRITAATPAITSGQTVAMRILEETADAGITFFVDGLQIETGSTMTQWVNGVRSAGSLAYSAGLMTLSADFTFNAWVLMPIGIAGACLFSLGSTLPFALNTAISVTNADGLGTNIRFATGPAGSSSDSITASGLSRGVWTMITCVMRTNPRSGQAKKELWVNGVLSQSSSPSLLPDLSLTSGTYIGARPTGANTWSGGQIDDVQILPYAAGPGQIAAWYAAARSLATQPRLTLAGDILRSWETLTVEAYADKSDLMAASDGTTFYNAMRTISCTIEER